jgi:hypothetical protein
VPRLLRRRGAVASRDRLREAAESGYIPARRVQDGAEGWRVDEADLDAIAAYFRKLDEAPGLRLPGFKEGAGAVELALARGAGTVRR